MFTDEQLKKLVFPLVIEQMLAMTMGLVDTMMVASCGEAAVSGISLVDTISFLLIGLFGAMSSGGAVVVAQYFGKGDKDKVARASGQLFLAVTAAALAFMAVALIWNGQLLGLIYGNVEADVMGNARTYFYISAVSFPFLAVYNGGAALFRAVGNSRVSMQVSLFANILNIAGNALLIYGFRMGVAGAGFSTLFSRALSAGVICAILMKRGDVPVRWQMRFDWLIMRRILYIGIPNGLENSIFQLGKILVSSLIASFGTASITANAVVGSVGNFQLIPTNAVGMAIITVVGQCVGAGEYEQARKYLYKLLRAAYVFVFVIGIGVIVLGGPVCSLYHLSEETTHLTRVVMIYNCICCMLIHPLAFAQPNGLRAAGDVRFTMLVSIGSMWTCRIGLAYVLGRGMGLGLLGVWIAMTTDWLVRAIFFTARIMTGKWEAHMGALTKE